jgi:hypothetical protein
MDGRTDEFPVAVVSAKAGRWVLFNTAFIVATAVAMIGWLWAIGWFTVAIAKWLIG